MDESTYKSMPPKKTFTARVRYVQPGSGKPRKYQLDDDNVMGTPPKIRNYIDASRHRFFEDGKWVDKNNNPIEPMNPPLPPAKEVVEVDAATIEAIEAELSKPEPDKDVLLELVGELKTGV